MIITVLFTVIPYHTIFFFLRTRQAFKKNPCAKLKVLWLQRLDLWDDLESLALALGPAHCPVLQELFLDLALDTDDVVRLAKCLHK